MGNVEKIKYDYNKCKSFEIYPRKTRQPISQIPISAPIRQVRRALNAAESQLKDVMKVANRRLDTIMQMRESKKKDIDCAVKELVEESVSMGHHLVNDLFIPDYLGFTQIVPDEDNNMRIFSKDGFNMTLLVADDKHPYDRWLIFTPENGKPIVKITNMFEGITILNALGLDLNCKDYMDGKYSGEKGIVETMDDVVAEIIENRKKEAEKWQKAKENATTTSK